MKRPAEALMAQAVELLAMAQRAREAGDCAASIKLATAAAERLALLRAMEGDDGR